MNRSVRRALALVAGGAFCVPGFSIAQEPTETERSKLLKEVEEIRELLEGGIAKNNSRAVAGIRNAMGSPKATYELYMDCVHEVDFVDVGKRESDWREWRDRNEDRLKSSEHIKARQYQLRYLELTLRATSGEDDQIALKSAMPELVSFINDLTTNFASFAEERGVLRESVIDCVFSKRGKLDLTIDRERTWVFSPLSVSQMYEKVILPFYRGEKNSAAIKSAWDKRILHEGKLYAAGAMQSGGGGGRRNEIEGYIRRFTRGGRNDRDREREEKREDSRLQDQSEKEFVTNRLPVLKWGKARDALFYGSGKAATLSAMNRHIREHIDHPNAKDWLKEVTAFTYGDDDPAKFYGKKEEA